MSEAECCTTCTDEVFLHLMYTTIDSELFFVILFQMQDDLLEGVCLCGVIRHPIGGGIVINVFLGTCLLVLIFALHV